MGRLQALIVAAALGGCPEEAPEPPPRPRADMVERPPEAAPPDAGHARTATHADGGAAPARVGPLCETPREGLAVAPPPSQPIAGRGAEPPAPITTGAGRWTWFNLWAAWCMPCREEMPLLRRLHEQLSGQGPGVDLVFVSLDDDERQLRQLLDRALPDLPRASAWMPGGTARRRWLESLGMRDNPALPVQIFVDPAGQLGCIVRGALEEGDLARLRDLVSR